MRSNNRRPTLGIAAPHIHLTKSGTGTPKDTLRQLNKKLISAAGPPHTDLGLHPSYARRLRPFKPNTTAKTQPTTTSTVAAPSQDYYDKAFEGFGATMETSYDSENDRLIFSDGSYEIDLPATVAEDIAPAEEPIPAAVPGCVIPFLAESAPATSPKSIPEEPHKKTSPKSYTTDRFIPSRRGLKSGLDLKLDQDLRQELTTPLRDALSLTLFNQSNEATQKTPVVTRSAKTKVKPLLTAEDITLQLTKRYPYLTEPPLNYETSPFHVCDAPKILQDYYVSLMDYSCNGMLGIALGDTVYLRNSAGKITGLPHKHPFTSIKWHSNSPDLLFQGLYTGDLQIMDITRKKIIADLKPHDARVSVIAHTRNYLLSGSMDAGIALNDYRSNNAKAIWKVIEHKQELCSLEFSINGYHFVSGSNDTTARLWDIRNPTASLHTFNFNAAVKVAFHPTNPDIFVGGGGTDDKYLRSIHTGTKKILEQRDMKAQICGLAWYDNGNQLAVALGYTTNTLNLFTYRNELKEVAVLTGHQERVLKVIADPTQPVLASLGGDETLRFWKVPNQKAPLKKRESSAFASVRLIR